MTKLVRINDVVQELEKKIQDFYLKFLLITCNLCPYLQQFHLLSKRHSFSLRGYRRIVSYSVAYLFSSYAYDKNSVVIRIVMS